MGSWKPRQPLSAAAAAAVAATTTLALRSFSWMTRRTRFAPTIRATNTTRGQCPSLSPSPLQIDGAAVLSEMDDAIVRLRKWQLDRELTRLEMEAELQHAMNVKAARVTSVPSSSSSSGHGDDDCRAAAASQRAVAAVEALLQAQATGPDRRVDLSVLAQQDRALATEADRTLAEEERAEDEIREAVCRRRREEVMYGGAGLEADVSSLTAQLRHYSDDLDSLLARAEVRGDTGVGHAADATSTLTLPLPPSHFK